MGAARVNGDIGVLSEPRKRDQHGFDAAAGYGNRHAINARHADGVPGAGRQLVEHRFGRHHPHGVGEPSDFQRGVQHQWHRAGRLDPLRMSREPRHRDHHVEAADRQVWQFEATSRVGRRHTLEPARRMRQRDRGAGKRRALLVDDRTPNRRRHLGMGRDDRREQHQKEPGELTRRKLYLYRMKH